MAARALPVAAMPSQFIGGTNAITAATEGEEVQPEEESDSGADRFDSSGGEPPRSEAAVLKAASMLESMLGLAKLVPIDPRSGRNARP